MAETKSIEQYLAGLNLFSGLDSSYLQFLADCARRREVDRGDVLFKQGTAAEHFYLLVKGSISVEVPAIEGPPVQLQRPDPGEVMGWSWLIPPYRWNFQARAVEPSEVIEFDGKAILERCEDDSAFGYEILKRFSALMSERLEFARRKMMDEWSPPGFA